MQYEDSSMTYDSPEDLNRKKKQNQALKKRFHPNWFMGEDAVVSQILPIWAGHLKPREVLRIHCKHWFPDPDLEPFNLSGRPIIHPATPFASLTTLASPASRPPGLPHDSPHVHPPRPVSPRDTPANARISIPNIYRTSRFVK